MRFPLLALFVLPLACGKEAAPPVAPTEQATAPVAETPPPAPKKSNSIAGPEGFPLPPDAVSKGDAPGGGGKIVVYEVPRGRDAVADELEKLVTEEGFTVDSKETSGKGSRRMAASKDGKTFKASVAGDGERSAIILTLP